MPPFLSRRLKRLVTDLVVHLAAWEGNKYDRVEAIPFPDFEGNYCPDGKFTGWKGQAVFSFQGAKRRFAGVFEEDVNIDQNLMMIAFKVGQQEVLELRGLWTQDLDAMDAETFWNEFIPPEADGSAGPRLPFEDTLQGHFKKRWEDNDGDLFSLEISATYRAANDDGNMTGSDEIAILAGLNGDYILFQAPFLLRKWDKVVALSEIAADPAVLCRAFNEALEFFERLN